VYALRPAWKATAGLGASGTTVPAPSWDGHPAATDAWARAAARAAPTHRWVVLGQTDRPLGFLTAKAGFHGPVLFPLGYHHGGFRLRSEVSDAAVRALAEVGAWHACYLPFCTEGLAQRMRAQVSRVLVRSHDVASVVVAADLDAYLAERPRRLRATIRQADRRLEEHACEIVRVEGACPTGLLDELSGIEAAGHRQSGHPLSGRHGPFIRSALAELGHDGLLEIWLARASGESLGYLVTCQSPQSTYFYTMAIRGGAEDLSLGTAIFWRAIAYSIKHGKRINLGPGGTMFKRRFETGRMILYDLVMVPRYTAGLAPGLIRALPATRHGGKWR
jgi:hypothetical protein